MFSKTVLLFLVQLAVLKMSIVFLFTEFCTILWCHTLYVCNHIETYTCHHHHHRLPPPIVVTTTNALLRFIHENCSSLCCVILLAVHLLCHTRNNFNDGRMRRQPTAGVGSDGRGGDGGNTREQHRTIDFEFQVLTTERPSSSLISLVHADIY